jgi:hypothetical protein
MPEIQGFRRERTVIKSAPNMDDIPYFNLDFPSVQQDDWTLPQFSIAQKDCALPQLSIPQQDDWTLPQFSIAQQRDCISSQFPEHQQDDWNTIQFPNFQELEESESNNINRNTAYCKNCDSHTFYYKEQSGNERCTECMTVVSSFNSPALELCEKCGQTEGCLRNHLLVNHTYQDNVSLAAYWSPWRLESIRGGEFIMVRNWTQPRATPEPSPADLSQNHIPAFQVEQEASSLGLGMVRASQTQD